MVSSVRLGSATHLDVPEVALLHQTARARMHFVVVEGVEGLHFTFTVVDITVQLCNEWVVV